MAQNIYFLLCIIMKHKTQDYKITAVKYYLHNDVSLDEVCNIFDCKMSSLRRWIMDYGTEM
jgi:transposase-like protein